MTQEASYHGQLNDLARELAYGSRRTVLVAEITTKACFEKAYGRKPNTEELAAINTLFPTEESDSRWYISSYAVDVQINEDGDRRRFGLGEFIAGIAVANGIHPIEKDVQTVIYHLGRYMGELSING